MLFILLTDKMSHKSEDLERLQLTQSRIET